MHQEESRLATTELSEDERRVLRALKEIHDRDLPPTTHVVAELVGSTFGPTRRVLNMLFEHGLVNESLTLTDEGRKTIQP